MHTRLFRCSHWTSKGLQEALVGCGLSPQVVSASGCDSGYAIEVKCNEEFQVTLVYGMRDVVAGCEPTLLMILHSRYKGLAPIANGTRELSERVIVSLRQLDVKFAELGINDGKPVWQTI